MAVGRLARELSDVTATVSVMDAEVSATVAAWVAALFGGGGFVLGIMAFVRSGRANEAATRSNAIAEDANALAEESNRIAQSSADAVAAADARAVEQHDVRWDREWIEAGVYRLTNIGRHVAREVVANVHLLPGTHAQESRSVGEVATVEPGGHIDVKVDGIAALHGAMELDYAGRIGEGGWHVVPIQPEVEERVFWRSPLGAPHEHVHRGQVWFDAAKVHRGRERATEQG